jgi:hypothetical protein
MKKHHIEYKNNTATKRGRERKGRFQKEMVVEKTNLSKRI